MNDTPKFAAKKLCVACSGGYPHPTKVEGRNDPSNLCTDKYVDDDVYPYAIPCEFFWDDRQPENQPFEDTGAFTCHDFCCACGGGTLAWSDAASGEDIFDQHFPTLSSTSGFAISTQFPEPNSRGAIDQELTFQIVAGYEGANYFPTTEFRFQVVIRQDPCEEVDLSWESTVLPPISSIIPIQ